MGRRLGDRMAIVSAAAPAHPVKLSPNEATTALKDIEKDRTDTQKWLQSDPTSYLATIDRRDFEQKKTLSVGEQETTMSDRRSSHRRASREGDRRRRQIPRGRRRQEARFKIGREGCKDLAEKRDATVDPRAFRSVVFCCGSHINGIPRSSCSIRRARGSNYGDQILPPDLSCRYELALTPNPKPNDRDMSTRGNQRRADKVGWFDFIVGTTPVRLEALRLLEPGVGENDLGIFFRDTTTGKESYELGRYVDVKKLANGNYLLDFNFTYNPACAYSDHYNCPIPPKANVLPVAIRAGEMDAHYH
jgi:hypothetical protein